ncbi:MAG: hypothetical protein RLZZ603_1412 [Actinomycetota bacterium]|jgi:hypothetical protein
MRLSQFSELMNDEFGAPYARVLLDDLVLGSLNDLTGAQALAAGVDPREVWQAICRQNGVPAERWHGKSKPKPKLAK